MPLMHGKSDRAFEHNIRAEMHAGKPQKQAVAIAYSEKRRAAHKAHGGLVEDLGNCKLCYSEDGRTDPEMMAHGGTPSDMDAEQSKRFMERGSVGSSTKDLRYPKNQTAYAEGGAVDDEERALSKAEAEEHDPEMEGEEELMHGIAGEFMDALERKDKKAMLEAMHAIMSEMKLK